jgi:hypothetical protein
VSPGELCRLPKRRPFFALALRSPFFAVRVVNTAIQILLGFFLGQKCLLPSPSPITQEDGHPCSTVRASYLLGHFLTHPLQVQAQNGLWEIQIERINFLGADVTDK